MKKKLWKVYDGLITDGNQVLKISEFNLPPVEPCILELTDGGPGVGVSNVEVKFRDEEIVLLTIQTDVLEYIVLHRRNPTAVAQRLRFPLLPHCCPH